MAKKKTHREFKQEIYDLVGKEYELMSLYVNTRTKVKLRHKVCGNTYEVEPYSFLRGSRCPQCNKRKKKNLKIFTQEVFNLEGEGYTVLGDYKGVKHKIKMRHNECGSEYEVSPGNFMFGSRCPLCCRTKHKKTRDDFEREVYDLEGDNYKLIGGYEDTATKVKIKHRKCGVIYEVKPNSFLTGNRCPECYGTRKKSTDEFKQEVYTLEGEEYKVIGGYINSRTKIEMKHTLCGNTYYVSPVQFIRGGRCPFCKGSKGEMRVKKQLEYLGLKYEREYVIKKNSRVLRVDFIVRDIFGNKVLGIEYDGIQHYKPFKYFGGVDKLIETQERDRIKDSWFKDNNIDLLRISYKDYENIENLIRLAVKNKKNLK